MLAAILATAWKTSCFLELRHVYCASGKLVERRSTRMPCRDRIFKNLKLGRQFVLSLRTILVRYDFDDNTPIDSGAEGGCFAKGADVEFTPHRASHESHSIPGLRKRYSVGIFLVQLL